jgi:galactoside 2-L-fucosyltransferase 1/2
MVFIITGIQWTQGFKNQQVIINMLSPHPDNQTLDYESSLCSSPNVPLKPPPHNKIHCPQKPIVTVKQLGRLGNQMYEYISVWAIAKKTGREPYVPSCMIREMGKIFQNLTVPPLSYLADCNIEKYPTYVQSDLIDYFNGSMLLPHYAQIPKYIAPLVSEIQQIFQFKEYLVDESQRFLHSASKGVKNITYVGVHVRRTDYNNHLKSLFNASMVKPDFFLRQMNVLRNKYKPILFAVVSDDPEWCERELNGDDVVVMRNKSPAQDLAIMAACNHSIIDYGTYGMWGAILSGGDAFVYNLTNSYDAAFEMASLLPNWHIVT